MKRITRAVGIGIAALGLVLGTAGVATADARQDFLDQYNASGAYRILPDDQLLYWATQYCHDKADGNGAYWHSNPFNMTYSLTTTAQIADRTLCPDGGPK